MPKSVSHRQKRPSTTTSRKQKHFSKKRNKRSHKNNDNENSEQKKTQKEYLSRQTNVNIPVTQRIYELLHKNKRKNKNKKKNKNNKRLTLTHPQQSVMKNDSNHHKKTTTTTTNNSKLQIQKQSKRANNKGSNNDSRLDSAHFRWLNEMFYSTTGDEAMHNFKNNNLLYNRSSRHAFENYHKTYHDMTTTRWPESPLDRIIKCVEKNIFKMLAKASPHKPNTSNKQNKSIKQNKQTLKNGNQQLSNNNTINKNTDNHVLSLTVVDMGCGDAKFAQHFFGKIHRQSDNGYKNKTKNKMINKLGPLIKSGQLRLRILSFDVIALNKYVTVCNIMDVTAFVANDSCDLCVFCLSLMGTDFHKSLSEAHRILKTKTGILKIAEVRSRFYGINKFERFLNRCGFDVVSRDLDDGDSNQQYFVIFHCKKSSVKLCQQFSANFDCKAILKPCLYKRR